MVSHLYDETMASVADDYVISKAFAMTNGVKQECVFAPILFSLIFSAMLTDAYCDERLRIRIGYSTEGHLLNSRRIQAPTRLFTTTIHGLLSTEDCALNSTTEKDMQRSMNLLSSAALTSD
nr:unnamed protein product [Spirometra erinaceieuropaei]